MDFFKTNEHMQNLYFKLAAILNKVYLDLIFIFYNKMELRILNINGPLIKVSITDGRRLILHYCLIHGGHLETIRNGGWNPGSRGLTS